MKIFFKETSMGKIGIRENNGFITHLYFEMDTIPEDIELCETRLSR